MSTYITLEDIAREVGLSRSAVSLALRDHPRIPAATRERVRAAAARLGYRPNAALAALAAYRYPRTERAVMRETVLILDLRAPRGQSAGRETVPSLLTALNELGYAAHHEAVSTPTLATFRTLNRLIIARRVRGILLLAGYHEPREFPLPWHTLTCVRLGGPSHSPCFDNVTTDYYECAALALREIHTLGHRRIGLWHHAAAHRWAGDRILGGLGECARALGLAEPPCIRLAEPDLPDLHEHQLAWARDHRLTAILSASFDDAWPTLTAAGLGYAALDIPKTLEGRVAGVSHRRADIAAAAARQLHGALTANRLGWPEVPSAHHLPGRWCAGSSLPQIG
jgi:LacI family transcriptional regulator